MDAAGRSLYLFTRDERNVSNCAGGCALAWPPLITVEDPVPGEGLAEDRIGTTAREDGSKQVTYNGRPLYYFAADEKPGDARHRRGPREPGRPVCQLCENYPQRAGMESFGSAQNKPALTFTRRAPWHLPRGAFARLHPAAGAQPKYAGQAAGLCVYWKITKLTHYPAPVLFSRHSIA